MNQLKPKAHHEQLLANVDKVKIVQHLSDGEDIGITRIAVALARQCDLLDHFQRLWLLRVSELDEKLRTEAYMKNVYVNKRALYKELSRVTPPK